MPETWERWSDAELEQVRRYFETNITPITLYQRIHKINSKRSYMGVHKKIWEYRKKGFEKNKETALRKLRIGYLDIETTDLNADFGYILTWYIKPRSSKDFDFSVITKDEIVNGDYDKRIVKELLEAFNKYDKLYTHYGGDRRFDIPFIRTRALINGYEKLLPKRLEKFIGDTWVISRNKLKFRRNTLDNIAKRLRIKGVSKTHLEPEIWRRAQCGNKEAIDYIALHNKRDVQLLERVHKKLEFVENPTLTSI